MSSGFSPLDERVMSLTIPRRLDSRGITFWHNHLFLLVNKHSSNLIVLLTVPIAPRVTVGQAAYIDTQGVR